MHIFNIETKDSLIDEINLKKVLKKFDRLKKNFEKSIRNVITGIKNIRSILKHLNILNKKKSYISKIDNDYNYHMIPYDELKNTEEELDFVKKEIELSNTSKSKYSQRRLNQSEIKMKNLKKIKKKLEEKIVLLKEITNYNQNLDKVLVNILIKLQFNGKQKCFNRHEFSYEIFRIMTLNVVSDTTVFLEYLLYNIRKKDPDSAIDFMLENYTTWSNEQSARRQFKMVMKNTLLIDWEHYKKKLLFKNFIMNYLICLEHFKIKTEFTVFSKKGKIEIKGKSPNILKLITWVLSTAGSVYFINNRISNLGDVFLESDNELILLEKNPNEDNEEDKQIKKNNSSKRDPQLKKITSIEQKILGRTSEFSSQELENFAFIERNVSFEALKEIQEEEENLNMKSNDLELKDETLLKIVEKKVSLLNFDDQFARTSFDSIEEKNLESQQIFSNSVKEIIRSSIQDIENNKNYLSQTYLDIKEKSENEINDSNKNETKTNYNSIQMFKQSPAKPSNVLLKIKEDDFKTNEKESPNLNSNNFLRDTGKNILYELNEFYLVEYFNEELPKDKRFRFNPKYNNYLEEQTKKENYQLFKNLIAQLIIIMIKSLLLTLNFVPLIGHILYAIVKTIYLVFEKSLKEVILNSINQIIQYFKSNKIRSKKFYTISGNKKDSLNSYYDFFSEDEGLNIPRVRLEYKKMLDLDVMFYKKFRNGSQVSHILSDWKKIREDVNTFGLEELGSITFVKELSKAKFEIKRNKNENQNKDQNKLDYLEWLRNNS